MRGVSIACCMILGTLGLAVRGARGGEVPSALADSYGPAVSRIQDAYSHATITGTVLREYPLTGDSYEQRNMLRVAGPRMRLDITTTSRWQDGPPVGSIEVILATPDASLRGVGVKAVPALDTTWQLSYSEAKARIDAAFPIDQPFSLGGSGTVLDFLRSAQVRVGDVNKIDHKGQQYVKVVWQDAGGNAGAPKSYVLLSPSEGWAVREYSTTSGAGSSAKTLKGKISYTQSNKGLPLVERIESWEYDAERRCVLHEVVTVTRFTEGDPANISFGADGFK